MARATTKWVTARSINKNCAKRCISRSKGKNQTAAKGSVKNNFHFLTEPLAQAEALTGQIISICEDNAEWPPYHYLKRQNGKKTNEPAGYGIDILNEIFGKRGIKFKISFLPWKRCLHNVKEGKFYQMALSGSYNLERDKAYHLVNWYKTNVYYFYSKKHYPDGLKIKGLSDFKKYKLVGLLGYNYPYLGELEKKMNKDMKNYDQMMQVLHKELTINNMNNYPCKVVMVLV